MISEYEGSVLMYIQHSSCHCFEVYMSPNFWAIGCWIPWFISSWQSYEIKFPPWTILWLRILGIFSVEYIKRLCVFMFKSCSNSQLLRRVLWISAEQPIGASLKHKNTQPLYIFNRVRVLHLNRLKERTWLHSFDSMDNLLSYGGLDDARISASEKDLPISLTDFNSS